MISAFWEWLDQNPEACELLYHHLPGMTTRAVTLQREFEEIHLRLVDYIPPGDPDNAPLGPQPSRGRVWGAGPDRAVPPHPPDARSGRPAPGRPDRRVREAFTNVSQRLLAR